MGCRLFRRGSETAMPSDLQLTDRRFNRLALLGIASGFALLLGVLAAVVTSFSAYQSSSQLVRHTYEVVDQLSLLDVQLERAQSGRRAYLLSPNGYRFQVYRDNVRLAPQTLNRIAALTGDNPAEVANVAQLRNKVQLQLLDLRRSMALVQAGQRVGAQAEFAAASPNSIIREIRALTAHMRQIELSLLNQRVSQLARTLARMQVVLLATGLMLLLVGAGSFWLVRRYTVDLTRTRDRLHELNADLEGAVKERTAELQRANEEIQRFAYIVSHDLRSPLVNVMGFTAELEQANKSLAHIIDRAEAEAPEIVTEEVRQAREELPEAIGSIRSSTQKMDRLINAILKLSREGRRKYAYPKGSAGEVRVQFGCEAPNRFMLAVEDDGRGIEAGAAPQGTGLGSKLITAMAKALSSRVEYEDRPLGVRAVLSAAC
jgi:CHASE3 domain sensor protein